MIPCPVCGSEDIKGLYDHNGIMGPGARSTLTGEVCNNCEVKLNPKRSHTKKYEDKFNRTFGIIGE